MSAGSTTVLQHKYIAQSGKEQGEAHPQQALLRQLAEVVSP